MEITLNLNEDLILDENDVDLLTDIAYDLEKGIVFEQDYKTAAKMYSIAAKAKDGAQAANNLGWLYLNGFGVDKDIPLAIELFTKAAKAGNTTAMVNLGSIYEGDWGNTPDYKQALKWYKKAAELGDKDGKFNYANMYHYGRGVRKNRQKAYTFFRELYLDGYSDALFYMGYCNYFGYAVPKDYVKSLGFYLMGATEGDFYCCNELGVMFAKGHGVKKDFQAAFSWYQKGAAYGDGLAISNLAYCYETGQGVDTDINTAIKLYQISASKKCNHAIEALERLGVSVESTNTEAAEFADGTDTFGFLISEGDEKLDVLAEDPLAGVTPQIMREIYKSISDTHALAFAYAVSHNKAVWFLHNVDNEDCPAEMSKEYDEWFELCDKLYSQIHKILVAKGLTDTKLDDSGQFQIAEPFMEMFGYQGSGGWWIHEI